MYRCKYLAHGLYISYDCFRHCHLSIHAPEERENNFIVNYKGSNDKVDWDLVFAKKKELVEGMRKGEIPNFCKGCHWLEEFDENSPEQYLSDLDSYIDMIWLGHFNECNARCLYCHAFELLSRKSITKDYGVITLLQEMFEKKIYNLEKILTQIFRLHTANQLCSKNSMILWSFAKNTEIGILRYIQTEFYAVILWKKCLRTEKATLISLFRLIQVQEKFTKKLNSLINLTMFVKQ